MGTAQMFSTEHVRRSERTAYWRDHVWASMGRFDVATHDAQFCAAVMT